MTTRVLPPEEWSKLAGTEIGPLVPSLNPESVRIVVVEDDGLVVGCWAVMQCVHVEGLWIAPDRRGKGSVGRRLWRGMVDVASEVGAASVITGAVDDSVRALIAKAGGSKVPCDQYVIPLGRPASRPAVVNRAADAALLAGRRFHEQLEALIHEPNHPDDDEHDRRVGAALIDAIDGGDPTRAMAEYNAWADRAGYAPVRYIGAVTRDGATWLRADIQTAVIDIASDYAVRIVQEETCHS